VGKISARCGRAQPVCGDRRDRLVPIKDAFAVFSNPAPITVAAMFVLSAALLRCGALDYLSGAFEKAAVLPYQVVIFLLVAWSPLSRPGSTTPRSSSCLCRSC
jgi:di/tricarboxylate transporter